MPSKIKRRAITPIAKPIDIRYSVGGALTIPKLDTYVQQINRIISTLTKDSKCKEVKESLEIIIDRLISILRVVDNEVGATKIATVIPVIQQINIATLINKLTELRSEKRKEIIFTLTPEIIQKTKFSEIKDFDTFNNIVSSFIIFLRSINCVVPIPDVSPNTAQSSLVQYDSELEKIMVSYQDFDTPDAIQRWFEETVDIDVNGETKQLKKNYYAYLYGIGKIMKTKQELLTKNASDLGKQISKINQDYNSGISETGNILPQLILGDPDRDKKEKLVDSVVSDVNDTYKTQYFELIQKKIRYDEAIEKLISRRNYLVACFNGKEDGYEQIVNGNILPRAKYIFEKYRGTRYREIRRLLFVFIPICAFFPEVIEKSFILNTSITGPAGSGKTTLARILSKWYNAVGFLTGDPYLENPNDAYREVGRAELIAQYVGQTAPRTMGVLYSTLEKTLFIDEAYSVAGCSFDKAGKLEPDAYGEEFLSTLLPFIANHQGIGSVIVAGYKNLMELCFFKRNEGLPRRFPTKIDLPLYSTDELFVMFLTNVIERQVKTIKDKGVADGIRRAKQIIYLGIKPTFMMFHFDTTYHGIELLRKYLLLFQIRDQQFRENSYGKGKVLKSETITNHVLTSLLGNQLRRNIIRYYFYKQVFAFEASNLSYFPAQAGEMGLVADMANRKIEVEMNEQKQKGIIQKFLPYEVETDFMNSYFKDKNIMVRYFNKEQDPSMWVEVQRAGYGVADFQEIIRSVLNKGVFGNETPPLEDLFKKLFSDYPTILGKVMGAYVEIAKAVIPEILAKTENDFPVNMLRNEVEIEKLLIELYEKASDKSTTEINKTEVASYTNELMRQVNPNMQVNLQHYNLRRAYTDPAKEKEEKDYAYWEDLSFYIPVKEI